MITFDFQPSTRIVFGPGKLEALGDLAYELGGRRALVVSDPGVIAAGHAARGIAMLEHAGLVASLFRRRAREPDDGRRRRGRGVRPGVRAGPDLSGSAAAARWTAPKASISC